MSVPSIEPVNGSMNADHMRRAARQAFGHDDSFAPQREPVSFGDIANAIVIAIVATALAGGILVAFVLLFATYIDLVRW